VRSDVVNKGVFAIGLIMLLLGAFVASVKEAEYMSVTFLVIGIVLMMGSRFLGSGGSVK
jgi:membrane-bound ClpP family serine protease